MQWKVKLTATLLDAVGRCLYGDRFQSQLARELGVHDRTMRRWLADAFHPADEADTIAGLRSLLIAKIAACERMLKRLG